MKQPLYKVLFLILFILSGCLTGGLRRRYETPPRVALPLSPPLYEYVGAMHIHSLYSHDSRGTLEEILRDGKASGCDFLITTDHNSLGLKKYEGFHKGLLLIVGVELSTSKGHVVALNLDKMPSQRGDVPKLFSELRQKGAMAIVAHPTGKRGGWGGPKEGFMGSEVFNLSTFVHSVNIGDLILTLLFEYPLNRADALAFLLERPDRDLAFFDKCSQKGHRVLLAGVDAHAIPIPPLGALHLYAHLFPVVRLHILSPRLTRKDILKSLGRGRCFVSFDLLEDGTSFLYYGLIKGKKHVMMGGQIPFQRGIHLMARSPVPAHFVMLCNGVALAEGYGREFVYHPEKPGVYRVEVFLKRLSRKVPWIFSNPIWLGTRPKK